MKAILAGLIVVAAQMQSSLAAYVSEVVPVKYERAQAIADALNSLESGAVAWNTSRLVCKEKMTVLSNAWERLSVQFKERETLREKSPNVVSSGVDKIMADERTNALLLMGSEEDVAVLKETVSGLDVVRPQILIEAVIFEVSLNKPEQRRSKIENGPAAAVTNGSDAVSAVSVDRMAMTNNSDTSLNGFAMVPGFSGDLDRTITEIANDSRIKILQRPRIQTSDGVPASMFIGESPNVGRYYGCGAGYSSIQQLQTGITFEVNPRITAENSLLLDIHQTVERENGSTNIVNVGSVPITSRRELQVQLNVADKQTILLGGLIDEGKKDPSIPVFGRLFHKSSRSKPTEMMVAIRPTILPVARK